MPIPILSFIDDINKIARCGLDSLELNVYITKQIEMKRLNFNVGNANKKSKCQRLHIGKKASNCIPLYARNKIMDHATEITYLGDLVHGSGINLGNIVNRVSKAKGITIQIFNILDHLCLGPHHFKVALLLRRTLLISSVLYNSDCWYNISREEIKELNKVDQFFFARLFRVPSSAPFVSFFLECGEMELEMYIKAKRLLYFFNLVNREKHQLIYSFFMLQYSRRSSSDWVSTTLKDFEDLSTDPNSSTWMNSHGKVSGKL